MALYLTSFSYTPEARARMIEKPEDRREAARASIESVDGKLRGSGTLLASMTAGACGRHPTTFRWQPWRLPSAPVAR